MAKYDKPIGESGIEWANRTWSPVTGCSKVSAGCKFCYAETLSARLQAMGEERQRRRAAEGKPPTPEKYANGFAPTAHPSLYAQPAAWREPEWVFVNSMSDLLHPDFGMDVIGPIFKTMGVLAPWHRYQCLTKRPERWAEVSDAVIASQGRWPRNVLPGTSIEDRRALARLPMLAKAGDANTCRMLSVEPLLESLCDRAEDGSADVAGLAQRFTDARVGWVIGGGEATQAKGCRPAHPDWFRELRDACAIAGIPWFFKQYGGRSTTHEGKRGGLLATLDGEIHHAMPEVWRGPSPAERRAHAPAPELFALR